MKSLRRTNRYLLASLFALLLTIAGFVAWDRLTVPAGTDRDEPAPNSIAVLPLLNLSRNSDDEYFSDGISEEILNKLSTVPGLTVTSRTCSFSLRDSGLDIPAIGKRLHVSQILEGSVRKTGNSVRITVQLVDASEGFRLWTSTYDRELEDIFVVQEDIADSVVSALQIQFDRTNLQKPVVQNRVANVQAQTLLPECGHLLNGH